MIIRVAAIVVALLSTSYMATADSQEKKVDEMDDYVLLDDFTDDTSRMETSWDGFTDQVMGGRSELSVTRAGDTEGNYVRMRGTVSTKNNGGFIQIRLKLDKNGGTYDGSSHKGLRLHVRGKDSGYYIFLRTANTILPWKFFKAEVPVGEEWGIVEIPWSEFGSGDYGREKKLRTDKLKSVALVAYGKDFEAEIDLKEIGFYN